MSDKPLDILAAQTEATVDPVDAAFAGMLDAGREFFAAAATYASKISYGSAHVGMNAIRERKANDPGLVALETLNAIIYQAWPAASSATIPPIYDEAQPTTPTGGA
jgi:hypothetical protein